MIKTSVFIVCLVVVRFSECGQMHLSSGAGGDVCEGGSRICLAGDATCINDRCVCNTGKGNGNFACYMPNEFFAEIKNDPMAISFARERVEVPMPCRFLVTHVITEFKDVDGTTRAGSCTLQVFSFSFKVRGKFFIQGFDAVIEVTSDVTSETVGASFRVVGESSYGNHQFVSWGKATSDENAPWGSPPLVDAFGQDLKLWYDDNNNRVKLNVMRCGFRLRFRPADIHEGKDQTQVPGLSIGIMTSHAPQWLSLDTVIALPPFGNGPTLGQVANELNLAPEEAMIVRSLQGAADQDFPGAAPACIDLINVAANLIDGAARKEAIEMCSFIIMSPPFLRNWSRPDPTSSQSALELFQMCTEAFYNMDTNLCLQVIAAIEADPVNYVHALPELMGFNCVF
ncbi:uncharacterized protein LOC131957841 [Physella acuta]|uniref:uncharacterized protein LOC131957841 n=1 Tax=Physella acuta TaxID=109671 RepID=UPI0027DCCD8B|nr:uncharacterized protein LOC131957841 [Physella acuta]